MNADGMLSSNIDVMLVSENTVNLAQVEFSGTGETASI